MDALRTLWVAVWLFPIAVLAQTAPSGGGGMNNAGGAGGGGGGAPWGWIIIIAIIVIALVAWSSSRRRRGPPVARNPQFGDTIRQVTYRVPELESPN
jgi:hypothetical protein